MFTPDATAAAIMGIFVLGEATSRLVRLARDTPRGTGDRPRVAS
jgi:uncharacterized protein with HEPN domain